MAIASMAKVMIVSHRSQAADVLEALQSEGIFEVLDADKAKVGKAFPELAEAAWRPKDVEQMLGRLEKGIVFLKAYAPPKKGLAAAFAPRTVVDQKSYSQIVSSEEILGVVERSEQLDTAIEKTKTEIESLQAVRATLTPWQALKSPVEDIGDLAQATCWTGLVPTQHLGVARKRMAKLGAVTQIVNSAGGKTACLVVALNEIADEVQKALRAAEFEAVSFEGMTGTVSQLMGENAERTTAARAQLESLKADAAKLSEQLFKLQVLNDHYRNLLSRERARGAAPATEQAVLLEGWVKSADYARLDETISRFSACSVGKIKAGSDEERPVEIENTHSVQPFEVVTRLYGMPHPTDVDPTVFFAPFFALFFGICLTDAAYGLVMIGCLWWLLKKIKGDAKFVKMMLICSVTTVVAGALTGGWCGDAIQIFFPQLKGLREAMMWFDPLEKPMHFFNISLGLGYLQIIFGIGVAFWHRWKRGEKREAICDHGTWFIWLNSLAIFGLAKAGLLPAAVGTVFGIVAIVPAIGIVLFSEREGGWGARIGMGCYNVFSTVFYVGDVLSYIRLMALGMVTAGFGMAINSIVKQVMTMGVLGWILGALVFIGGHLFNIANSCLSAFVHSMRLQFVEFFTKFLQGGGKQFDPLRKDYKHIQVDTQSAK